MTDVRIEKDSLGELSVPGNALYGVQTQRAVENFQITGLRPWRAFIWSMATIKQAAARVNADLGLFADREVDGRRYAGEVQQIISGSIGFDDWEWGVDLFADNPLVFKKLVYEMRFDEASADYALFGPFYVGLRCPASRLGALLEGELPEHERA